MCNKLANANHCEVALFKPRRRQLSWYDNAIVTCREYPVSYKSDLNLSLQRLEVVTDAEKLVTYKKIVLLVCLMFIFPPTQNQKTNN